MEAYIATRGGKKVSYNFSWPLVRGSSFNHSKVTAASRFSIFWNYLKDSCTDVNSIRAPLDCRGGGRGDGVILFD